MFGMRFAALFVGVLGVLAGGGAFAHNPGTSSQPATTDGTELTLTVQVDPAESEPPS